MALAGIGTAVALYPVVKRQNEGVALGFVGSRTLEAAAIFAGVVEPALTGDSASGLEPARMRRPPARRWSRSYNWLFLLGRSLMPVMNALLLGSLLYRSRLVPRVLPVLGFIGAALLLVSDVAVLFGVVGPDIRSVRTPRHPDRALGVLAGRLPDRQRLQALPDHSGHDR